MLRHSPYARSVIVATTATPSAPASDPSQRNSPRLVVHPEGVPHCNVANEYPMIAPPAAPTNTATNAATRIGTDGSADSGPARVGEGVVTGAA